MLQKVLQRLELSYQPHESKLSAAEATKFQVEKLINEQAAKIKEEIKEEIERRTKNHHIFQKGLYDTDAYCSDSLFEKNKMEFDLHDQKICNENK